MPTPKEKFEEVLEEFGIDFSLEEPPFEVGDCVVLVHAHDFHLQDWESREGIVVECRPYTTVLTDVLSWTVFVDFGGVVCPVSMAFNALDSR
jgi:hypothetical protein